MQKNMRKFGVDVASMIMVLIAIVSGFILHKEVWHLHEYDDTTTWGLHECVGIILIALVCGHCVQHSFWFKNYVKIKVNRKRVTTILLVVGMIVAVSGLILMFGSRSESVSHIHYIGAIVFTVLAIGHVAKRWKMLKTLKSVRRQ